MIRNPVHNFVYKSNRKYCSSLFEFVHEFYQLRFYNVNYITCNFLTNQFFENGGLEAKLVSIFTRPLALLNWTDVRWNLLVVPRSPLLAASPSPYVERTRQKVRQAALNESRSSMRNEALLRDVDNLEQGMRTSAEETKKLDALKV